MAACDTKINPTGLNKQTQLLVHATNKDQCQGKFDLMTEIRAEFLFISSDFPLGISVILGLRMAPNPISLPTLTAIALLLC